jgi:hypothetical protein
MWEGILIFRDCCGHSSWLGIHKLPDPLKAFKARMHNSGVAIKAALSVRPSVRIKQNTTSNDDTEFDPTNCIINKN